MANDDRNVLGGMLENCSMSPRTGFYRDGCCNTGPEDLGLHVVCTRVTREFLAFARRPGVRGLRASGAKPASRWLVAWATNSSPARAGEFSAQGPSFTQ